MKTIAIIGPSYCGKTQFTKYFEQNGWNILHLGDLCREKGKPADYQFGPEELAEIIDENVIPDNHPYVLDNLFKTVEGIKVVDYVKNINLSKDNMIIYLIIDCRSNVNFNSRGRADDKYIHMKRKIWDENCLGVLNKLDWLGYTVRRVYNTDKGFLCTEAY